MVRGFKSAALRQVMGMFSLKTFIRAERNMISGLKDQASFPGCLLKKPMNKLIGEHPKSPDYGC